MIALSGSVTSTATWPEVAWFVIGMVGLLVSAWNLRDCWRDSIALDLSGRNGLLRLAARGNTLEEILRVGKCLVICMIGVGAMTYPPQKPSAPVSPLSIFITFGLFVLGCTVVVGSLAARRKRAAMRDYKEK